MLQHYSRLLLGLIRRGGATATAYLSLDYVINLLILSESLSEEEIALEAFAVTFMIPDTLAGASHKEAASIEGSGSWC